MKVKTTTLTGAALDYAVAQALGEDYAATPETNGIGMEVEATHYSTNWTQGGPIIEMEGIGILFDAGSACRKAGWFATPDDQCTSSSFEGEVFEDPCFMVGEPVGVRGPAPLVAAMRCYVLSKLGPEVDVSDHLCKGATT
jgi:hypothetical protein